MQLASASNIARNSATNPPPLSDSVPHNCIPFGPSTKVTDQFEITVSVPWQIAHEGIDKRENPEFNDVNTDVTILFTMCVAL